MPQQLMDFNPLDILAAAALGQKDGSSNLTPSQKEDSSEVSTSSKDANDAEEDSEKDMGKAAKIKLKHPSSLKDTVDVIMPPHKSQWSPDAFLVSDLEDQIQHKHEKISIIELMQDLRNSAFGKKEHQQITSVDNHVKESHGTNNNNINNLLSVKNAANLQEVVLNDESEANKTNQNLVNSGVRSLDDKERIGTDSAPENVDHNSDTDTAESSDISKGPDPEQTPPMDFIGMDHPYALIHGQERPSPSMETLSEEDDVDVCSQNSPLNGHSPHYSHNMSPDCQYLKTGIFEDISSGTTDLYKISSYGRARLPSSSSSTSSPTLEMSSKCVKDDDVDSAQCTTPTVSDLASPDKSTSKFGKFRIGTFASFSSNNMELEKYLRNKDSPVTNGRKLNIGIPSDISFMNSSLSSPTASPSLHPLLQSPIQDWDRSEAGSEVHDDSSESRTPHRLSPDFTCEKITEWCHPLFHDHDYCLKEGEVKQEPDDTLNANLAKRKYTKRKNKLDLVSHEKILKAKYLKKELLKQEPPKKTPPVLDFSNIESSVSKSNPVGRPKKRPLERPIEEEIDPETGTKMKITGKFQDQYVYYLSKSSRTTSRRRQTPLPFPPDKIIVPAPKPGDIVVPHLTDADIETLRLKGRAALHLPGRPHVSNHVEHSMSSHHINDYDEDSHIVSTILSMENDNLSSAPSPAHSDIAGTSGLNPDQPALTESLQLMSGDNSITSEHVLNYLLSVVKEDVPTDNLLNGSDVEASSSALFPSLPSDSVYSKVDHLEESDLSQSRNQSVKFNHVTEDVLTDVSKNSRDEHSSHSIHNSPLPDNDHFTSSIDKEDKDQGRLPDDLSSFMSNSQGTSSSSSNTSQSVFSSDLSSLGTPQLSSSFPRLTSIEKTLDYLGVKDGDIKLDHNDLFTSKLHSETESSTLLTPESIASTEDDTPWIVTVTLYFNDVPAIMVNNQPYIRLVDIHKQILPAKDTGILKKRCQLLKIPVLNCSEMQRYFLVQYGRAYNSKSTLIISKDQATELVTYYATPQPRTGKVDEGSPQGRPSARDSDPGLPVSGVNGKKRSSKNCKKNAAFNGLLEPQYPDGQKNSSLSDAGASVQAPSKRTRHKKINYLEMLRGEEKKSSEDTILETIESVVRASPDYLEKLSKQSSSSNLKLSSKKKLKNIVVSDHWDKKTKKSKRKVNSKHSEKVPKFNNKEKLGNLVQKNKEDRIHIQDNEAWMKKLGTLVLDSRDSQDLIQGKLKHQPLKLKVNSLLNFSSQKRSSSPTKKGGLFSRSNSSASSSEAPLRVLAVAHQAAAVGDENESRLPSQPADIHLDLFTKSSSPCVRCQTCSQFLSVPHFMRHHHVPMDSEWLATEAAHRILVPRNKENISEQEKKLWEEFHALQEAIGGFGEQDDSDTDEDSADDFDMDDDPGYMNTPGTLSLLRSNSEQVNHQAIKSSRHEHMSSVTTIHTEEEESSSCEDDDDREDEPCLSPKTILADHLSKRLKNEMASRCGLVPRVPVTQTDDTTGKRPVQTQNFNLRTSSRKRKSKQLFSIENYLTPKKTGPEDETDVLSCSADLTRAADAEVVCSPIKDGRLSV